VVLNLCNRIPEICVINSFIGGFMFNKIFTVLVVVIGTAVFVLADEPADKKAKAVAMADEIISMRSNLAKTFIKPDTEITEETFKKVCGAVGKRVKEITEKEGVKIRHAATKYRNPLNAATPEEAEALAQFSKDKKLKETADTVEKEGKKYYRYTKPIFVEEACLACHGAKDKRPKFIIEKYSDDKAYDFKVGELRGVISVMIPIEGGEK